MNVPIIKKIKPINFLFHRAEVKISDVVHLLPMAKELFKEAVRLDLHPSGPIHWHYFGFTGEVSKQFTLEVCLPVASLPQFYDGKFHLKRTEIFKCASLVLEGDWQNIPAGYGVIMEFIQQQKLVPADVSRELFINVDFENPEANTTEIQMALI